MYIIKNSLKNLVRNKGRNFIILFVAFLTLTSVTLSFAIRNISDSSIQRYKDSFFMDATIDYDWERLEKDFPPTEIVNDDGSVTQESSFELEELTLKDYQKFAQSDCLKNTQYVIAAQFASDTLTAVPNNLHKNQEIVSIDGMTLEELMKFFHVNTREEVVKELGGETELKKVLDTKDDTAGSLVGYTDISYVEEFVNKEKNLTQGHFPEKDGECIVSSKYAEHNKLKIGDTIEVSGPSKSDTKIIPVKITGIYEASLSEAMAEAWGDLYGSVYTTYHTVADSGFHWISPIRVVFQLKDPESAERFEKELYQKGLSEYRFLSYSNEKSEYQRNTEPLKNISRIAEIFTLCAGAIGAAMILLIFLLNVRERKYEVGVLRAMGMKKSAVAVGFIFEILVMMAVGFGLSILVSTLLSQPIAGVIINNLNGASTNLSPTAILLCGLTALGLSVISGLCSVFTVMRHEPMKILAERN